jgi:hypothetical protein
MLNCVEGFYFLLYYSFIQSSTTGRTILNAPTEFTVPFIASSNNVKSSSPKELKKRLILLCKIFQEGISHVKTN